MRAQHLLLTASVSLIPASAGAAVIHVYADGSGDAPTIAAAYVLANSEDNIVLGPGTYFEHDIPNEGNVELSSETDDPTTTIIDAQQLGRCLLDHVGAAIRGITFQNGTHAVPGGLIEGPGNFTRCIFRNGSAPRGGAVYAGEVTFKDCLFEDNTATSGSGGAIWVNTSYGLNASAARCTFRRNTAFGDGGAIYTLVQDETLGFWAVQCVFEENVAWSSGGGIYSHGDEHDGTYLLDCTFLRNEASDGGAAFLSYYDHFRGCAFLDNEAKHRGGALFLYEFRLKSGEDNANYSNVFQGNRAGSSGGAIACQGSLDTALYTATFAMNEAPQGTHVAASGSLSGFKLYNAILCFGFNGTVVHGLGELGLYCCDVFGNNYGDYVGPLAGQQGVNGNFSADPLFCDPVVYDLTLGEGSPCLSTPCGRVGAFGLGCPAVSVEARSWGGIKAPYR